MRTKKLFTILTILFFSTLAYTQPGTLDFSFDPGTGANFDIMTTSIQSEGKIIIGGYFYSYNGTSRNSIARLNTDGSLDSSFDPGMGVTGMYISVNTTTIQNDGKIIIGGDFAFYDGTSRNRIARLNSDGSLDNSFDPGTGVSGISIRTLSIQSDGKIIIGGNFTAYNGTSRNCIARLNIDGSLDTFFNPGTGANDWVYATSIQSDGKIIIGGDFTEYNGTARNRIARLNTDGSLDNSFDSGSGANYLVYTSSIQSDGKIIIGGGFTNYNGIEKQYIASLNTDGSLDTSFDIGTGTDLGVSSISIQSDGKIIICGGFTSFNGTNINSIARLNTDGSLDNSFDPKMGANNWISTTNLQSDGKIIISGGFTSYDGTARNRIARIYASGTSSINPILNENETNFTIYPNPFSSHTTLQSDHIINNGTITIYNTLGKVVSQINNINGQSVTINRGNLSNGLYFIRLTEGKHEIMMKKVIVAE